jgi:hypothetical protein
VVAVEQDGKGVVAASLKLRHQLFIVQALQLSESWGAEQNARTGNRWAGIQI